MSADSVMAVYCYRRLMS